MPNYCYNSISFDGPDGALEELLASSDSDVDFERVIPMPASLDEANTTGASERLAVMAWLMHGIADMKWKHCELVRDENGGVAHVRPCEPDAFEVPSVLR